MFSIFKPAKSSQYQSGRHHSLWRDSQLRSLNGKLSKQKVLFANTTLRMANEKGKKLTKAIAKKAGVYQEIEVLE